MPQFKSFRLISKKSQIERWEQAVRVLKNLSPHERRKHWDMSYWGVKTECGTVACAAGHCGLDPWFRRRGFQMNIDEINNVTGNPQMPYNLSSFAEQVIDFFGSVGTDNIFVNGEPRPVGQVIREINAHIKTLKHDKS